MSDAETNRKAINENRKRIFSIDAEVMTNKALIYSSRAIIEENRSMILSNYSAAFMGNRQLANHNTDEIFKNRQAILDNVNVRTITESNFINAITEYNITLEELERLSLLKKKDLCNSKIVKENPKDN